MQLKFKNINVTAITLDKESNQPNIIAPKKEPALITTAEKEPQTPTPKKEYYYRLNSINILLCAVRKSRQDPLLHKLHDQ